MNNEITNTEPESEEHKAQRQAEDREAQLKCAKHGWKYCGECIEVVKKCVACGQPGELVERRTSTSPKDEVGMESDWYHPDCWDALTENQS